MPAIEALVLLSIPGMALVLLSMPGMAILLLSQPIRRSTAGSVFRCSDRTKRSYSKDVTAASGGLFDGCHYLIIDPTFLPQGAPEV